MVEEYGWGPDKTEELKQKLDHVEHQRDRYNQELMVANSRVMKLMEMLRESAKVIRVLRSHSLGCGAAGGVNVEAVQRFLNRVETKLKEPV